VTIKNVKLGIVHRVLTDYRVPFIDLLADRFPGGVQVAAGEARPEEQIISGKPQKAGLFILQNIHIMKNGLYLCHQRGLIDWLEKFDPDVLIMEANPRYLATPQTVRWIHQRRRPVIGWGLGIPPASSGLRSGLRLTFLQQFDAMLAYSRKGRQEYISAGIPAEKVFLASNAAAFKPKGSIPEHRSNFDKSPAVVLFVGRLQDRKRVDLLLEACARLDESIKPRVIIVGDGPERRSLEALAGRIYPRAEFTGDKRGDDLSDLFRQADLFVLPGTGGLALQQALSFALPAIAAEGDGTQADLVRPENGWLVPPGNLDSLVNALQTALQDPAALVLKGRESFRIVSDEVNLECMADAFEQAVGFVLRKIVR